MRAAKNYHPCGKPTKRSYAALVLCLLFSLSLLGGCSKAVLETKLTMDPKKDSMDEQSQERQSMEEKLMVTVEAEEEIIEEEPQAESFILSFAGDCTLADLNIYGHVYPYFTNTVGEDYGWPFRNVREIFEKDEMTFVNLEGVLGLGGYRWPNQFSFHNDKAYGQCLIDGSIEVVTLANNHIYDYTEVGYYETKENLDEWGIAYVGYDETLIYTTPNGLTIGFYGASWPKADRLEIAMEELKSQEVDLIICAFHYGGEGYYYPDNYQVNISRQAVDLGASIVYGSHPHVLQPIEAYNDSMIYYSMGNFCFGGNPNPGDMDSVIIQQEIIKEVDGTVHLGETTLIPCSVSSEAKTNNYQPTPYAQGSEEYDRVLRKLMGEYEEYWMSFRY